jgi:hypothetical protein
MDGAEHAAEVAALHQYAGQRDVRELRDRARPRRAHRQRERQHQRHHQGETQQQERQRLGIGQAVFRADEARAPQEHEQPWHRPKPQARGAVLSGGHGRGGVAQNGRCRKPSVRSRSRAVYQAAGRATGD